MKNLLLCRLRRLGVAAFLVSLSVMPTLVLAQGGGVPPNQAGGGITNPLKDAGITTFSQLLINVTQFLLRLVGILALLALVIGGIRLILALGREEEIKKAKTIIFWAVAGLIVVLLAFFIINTVGRLLGVNGP